MPTPESDMRTSDAPIDGPSPEASARDPIAALSPRRRDVLERMARGLTNEAIGAELGISPATVRTHVTAILGALGVGNRTEATALVFARPGSASVAELTPVLARPAIAVLPATSDGTPGAEPLALALSQELAALFSRWCWFPVIARSSTLDARTLGPNVGDIGRALSARFLIDPALRATRQGWRVIIQVDDVEDGHCLWTERYDFEHEPFAVLDEICAAVVASVYPVLMARVQVQLRAPAPRVDLQAWELAHRAIGLQHQRELTSNRQAVALSCAALEREPTLVLAHFGLGLCAYDAVLNQWDSVDAARDRLAAAGERCIALAPHAAEGYFLLGRYHQTRGDHLASIAVLEAAIARNPSFAAAHALLAQALNLCDRPDEALVRMQHAMRLGPRSFVAGLASLHFALGRYHLALECAERAIAITPRYTFARVLSAAAAFWADELPRGKQHLRELRHLYPAFEPRAFMATFGAHVPAVERLVEGLRRLDAVSVAH